jgi:surfactin synthase thioesterase subunit
MLQTEQTPARERKLARKWADKIQSVETKILDALDELPVRDQPFALQGPVNRVARAVRKLDAA